MTKTNQPKSSGPWALVRPFIEALVVPGSARRTDRLAWIVATALCDYFSGDHPWSTIGR